MIRRIRDAGVTILVIEHHMDLVMGISDHVAALDYGRKIGEGTPEEIQANERVIVAYLGDKDMFALPDGRVGREPLDATATERRRRSRVLERRSAVNVLAALRPPTRGRRSSRFGTWWSTTARSRRSKASRSTCGPARSSP